MAELAKTSEAVHRDYTGAKIGMWLFLFTEILLFGGLFLVYAVYRTKHQADFHTAAAELSVAIGAANTMILLTSSLTMALAIAAIRRSAKTASIVFQSLTILFAVIFLVNKYFEWGAKIGHGLYPNSPELLAQ
ncbi:MAG TPA: cytochrome C oxidase subunit III, partial [Nitrospiraceae bacterium]|nr:cytochrome C oxidase subunit III [Nitrospiraceae bacterium]